MVLPLVPGFLVCNIACNVLTVSIPVADNGLKHFSSCSLKSFGLQLKAVAVEKL